FAGTRWRGSPRPSASNALPGGLLRYHCAAQELLLEPLGHLPVARIQIDGRLENSLQRRLHQRQRDQANDRQSDAQGYERRASAQEPEDNKRKHRNAQQKEQKAETEIADQLFTPGFLQQLRRFLQRRERAFVFHHQDRDYQKAHQRPGHSHQARHKSPYLFRSFLDDPQDEAHRGRNDRPSENHRQARSRRAKTVADGRIAAPHTNRRAGDDGAVKENHDEIIADVEHKDSPVVYRLMNRFSAGSRRLPVARQIERNGERGQQQQTTHAGDQRKEQHLLVFLENLPTGRHQQPGAMD